MKWCYGWKKEPSVNKRIYYTKNLRFVRSLSLDNVHTKKRDKMRCHLISISYENAHCAPSMSFQRPFVGRYNREYHSRRHNDFGWWKKTWPYTVFICHSFPRQSKQTHALFYIRHSSVICMATECWGGPASQPLQISSRKKNYTGKNKDKLRKQYAAQQMNGWQKIPNT